MDPSQEPASEPTQEEGRQRGRWASFGWWIYLQLFKVMGPAQLGPNGPPAPINPDDKTVPAGYHLETIVDERGLRHRIAVLDDEPEAGRSPHAPS